MNRLLRPMQQGYMLLQAPSINKGDAFTQLERDAQRLQVHARQRMCAGTHTTPARYERAHAFSPCPLKRRRHARM
jgi:hypothetical protein